MSSTKIQTNSRSLWRLSMMVFWFNTAHPGSRSPAIIFRMASNGCKRLKRKRSNNAADRRTQRMHATRACARQPNGPITDTPTGVRAAQPRQGFRRARAFARLRRKASRQHHRRT
jgi:hypothetical protein